LYCEASARLSITAAINVNCVAEMRWLSLSMNSSLRALFFRKPNDAPVSEFRVHGIRSGRDRSNRT
jgi:hypothetical protein